MNNINTALGAKQACTNCGICKATVLPASTSPAIIRAYEPYAKKGVAAMDALSEPAEPEDCIECGTCTSCCPGKIAVKDIIREFAMR